MMNSPRISPMFLFILAISLVWLGGCSSAGQQMTLPDRRPADFTLGLVVFGDVDAEDVSSRSARYIVDADGYLRASVGAGSDAGTYPKITRRLNDEQLDEIWDMVIQLALNPSGGGMSNGRGQWDSVQSPEQFSVEDFTEVQGEGYLVEIRFGGTHQAWESMIDLGSPTTLVQRLAELAWIKD